MVDLLHAAAVAPAALGTCALAADRGRPRGTELAAALLMLAAMVDGAVLGAAPPVLWASVLLLAAMATAVLTGRRRRVIATRPAGADIAARARVGMSVHSSLGLVAMAALMVAMGRGSAMASGGVHAHGMSPGAVPALITLGAVAYGAVSLVLALRPAPPLRRAQFLTMGASTLIMAMGVVAS